MRALVFSTVLVISACAAPPAGTPNARSAPAAVPSTITAPCPVTTPPPVPLTPPPTAGTGPNPSLPFQAGPDAFLYGNDALIVVLPRDGSLHPNPSSTSEEIGVKFAWWRSLPGELVADSRRLDAASTSLSAIVPGGYGDRGFQVSDLRFSSPGCWQVIGTTGRGSLSFAVNVAAR